MSAVIEYQLRLLSDGENGTGLGGELINDVVARDHNGAPVIRASHIKGLLLDQLGRTIDTLDWSKALQDWCFGQGGGNTLTGMARFSDVTLEKGGGVRTISRTRLNDLGTAADTSLRTTEAVSAETVFHGTVRLAPDAPDCVGLAIRMAMLALEAVGGGRNRGSGRCLVTIADESRTPGQLLKALSALKLQELTPPEVIRAVQLPAVKSSGKAVIMRLRFDADQPVCCPENPLSENNVIRSGIAIPASAVLGAAIARLASVDVGLAEQTLASRATRAWPLLPCAPAGEMPVGCPVHVALSHRMSKLPEDQNHVFRDGAIDAYDWRKASPHSPLKGSDGVLLRTEEGSIKLWKSGDMPRVVAGHTVLNNDRNLYSMESMAPMVYEGFLSLPENAASELMKSLKEDGHVAFGKSRTVQGNGRLTASDVQSLPSGHSQVFVLQSPAAIPDEWDVTAEPAEMLLARLVAESGWGTVADQPAAPFMISVGSLAQCGVRFGWNTHGVGKAVGETRRLQARRVFLPGSVFRLAAAPDNIQALLLRGLGIGVNDDIDGRMQGFGAVLPHPGVAVERYEPPVAERKPVKSDIASNLALKWVAEVGAEPPSSSQISAVAERLARHGKKEAADYLDRQKLRPDRVWKRWDQIFDSLKQSIDQSPELALKALQIWRDISVSKKNSEEK